MNTYSTNLPEASTIEESAAQFQNDLAKADRVRTDALSTLHQLRVAKTSHAKREQSRLAALFGENHSEVVRIKAEVAAGERLNRELAAEADRVSTPAPVVDKGWAVYGFVRNQDLQPQPGLTVALFDANNRWVEDLGYTCTDDRGRFELRYAPGGKPTREQPQEVFVRVSTAQKKVLCRDKRPMSVVLGEVKYREIIVNDETNTCQPPANAPAKEPAVSSKPSAKSKSRKTRSPKKAPKDEKK